MKAFNTISNAKSIAESENGRMDTWGVYNNDHAAGRNVLKTNLLPYFKNSKVCETSSDCGITDDLKVFGLGGEEQESYNEIFPEPSSSNDEELVFVSGDGAIYSIYRYWDGGYGDLDITFDTNGIKGPNTVGRDIFYVSYSYGGTQNGKMATWTLEDAKEDCSIEGGSDPEACARRLLLEGKMDY